MSGYLKRLVANARNPSVPIHPIPGSVFAPAKYLAARLLFEEEETVARIERTTMALPERGREPDRAHEPEREFATAPDAVPAHEPERRSAPALNAVHSLMPNVPAPPSRSMLSVPELRPGQVDSAEQSAEALPQSTDGEINVRSFVPLLKEAARVQPNKSLPIPTAEPRALQYRARMNERKLSAVAGSDREPDQIEIHIGRIEVTAAPPPITRPQSKPTRKSPSLEEYLKRGNGQSR
ncbi:MAG: hypothetical protein JOZ48_09110 [Acidobacteriaceae bacterium]|nr:hypothetical protein [Acidobacteriaceae bacterium]MBV9764990.1 hypothetical protein [Acidobacteriaceae bacterium]